MSETLQLITTAITYFQFITAIVASIYFYKYKHTILKYLLPLLWYNALNEHVALIYSRSLDNTPNLIFYNVFFFITFTYYLILYKKSIKNVKFKKLVSVFIGLYLLSIGFEISCLKMNYFENSQVIPYITAASFVIICILYYLYEIFQSEEVIEVERKLLFWVSVALFLYYITFVPYKLDQNYISYFKADSSIFKIRIIVTLLFNFIYIAGFIWSRVEKEE